MLTLRFLTTPLLVILTSIIIDNYGQRSKLLFVSSLFSLIHFTSQILMPENPGSLLIIPYSCWIIWAALFSSTSISAHNALSQGDQSYAANAIGQNFLVVYCAFLILPFVFGHISSDRTPESYMGIIYLCWVMSIIGMIISITAFCMQKNNGCILDKS